MRAATPKAGASLAQHTKSAVAWALALSGALYLMSDAANATPHASEARYQAVIEEQQRYIKSLEKVVSLCFGDKENPVLVGNEWHLCRAVPTGIMQ